VTPFAVAADAAGANLPASTVFIPAISNIVADGIPMGLGNTMGIRSEEAARKAQGLEPEHPRDSIPHGLATFTAFVLFGFLPLLTHAGLSGEGGAWGPSRS
jgi:hypothetical protein